MKRFLLLAVLLVCLIYFTQASPLPDAPQAPDTDLDNLTNKAKKLFDDAKGALENANLNGLLEKAKTYIEQAGDNIRKELGKVSDKLND